MNATAQAFGIGTLIGIVLFFILARLGMIDKFLWWLEKK